MPRNTTSISNLRLQPRQQHHKVVVVDLVCELLIFRIVAATLLEVFFIRFTLYFLALLSFSKPKTRGVFITKAMRSITKGEPSSKIILPPIMNTGQIVDKNHTFGKDNAQDPRVGNLSKEWVSPPSL